jgi:hypothetical protein
MSSGLPGSKLLGYELHPPPRFSNLCTSSPRGANQKCCSLKGTKKLWRRHRAMSESAAAAADYGAHGFIGAEIFGAVDIKQGAQL